MQNTDVLTVLFLLYMHTFIHQGITQFNQLSAACQCFQKQMAFTAAVGPHGHHQKN